jgi:hypothetical protein
MKIKKDFNKIFFLIFKNYCFYIIIFSSGWEIGTPRCHFGGLTGRALAGI